jgi:hypothetical protein
MLAESGCTSRTLARVGVDEGSKTRSESGSPRVSPKSGQVAGDLRQAKNVFKWLAGFTMRCTAGEEPLACVYVRPAL